MRTPTLTRALLLATATSGLFACGGDDGGSSTAFLSDYGNALCEAYGRCCPATGNAFDVDQCKQFSSFQSSALDDMIQRGRLAFDAEQGDACMAALRGGADPCLDAPPMACQLAFVGRLGAGESCDDDSECAPPASGGRAECETDFDTGEGTCVAFARGKAGDACVATCAEEGGSRSCFGSDLDAVGAECYLNDGFYCDGETKSCKAQVALGEACQSDMDCREGFCGGEPRVCTALLADGSSCSHSDACASGYCNESEVCSPLTPLGSGCSNYDECGPDADCDDETKTCVASAGFGGLLACGFLGGGE
jgi:hypothetical protein